MTYNGTIIDLCFVEQKAYRSDMNYLRGAAWIATGALQIEGSKHATELISEVWHIGLIVSHLIGTL